MKNTAGVLLVATMDTKGSEALYLKSCLEEEKVSVLILDAGIMNESPFPVVITREEVARKAGMTLKEVRELGHEGEALSIMTVGAIGCALDLYRDGRIGGIIGLGGSMGTTLGTGVMRAFPVGFPKVMISTMASRNTRPFVGTKDIMMLHSVCDLSGINRITSRILRNGALALAGMVNGAVPATSPTAPLVALSTLGTTEACAVSIRRALEERGSEVVIFHTVGSGGEAMEEMVKGGEVDSMVDLSLHELSDHLFGGDYDAGPERGKTALQKGLPTVMAPGNTDFLVTGPLHEAELRFSGRKYHVHNEAITVVRTQRHEMKALAEVLAGICNGSKGPLAFLIPKHGFSAFDREGGPLHDPEAPGIFDRAFRKALQRDILLETLPYHINDPEFAEAIIQALKRLA
jgi:uncharacterized protein (UPF0261 family)